jgi:hypothetical protein
MKTLDTPPAARWRARRWRRIVGWLLVIMLGLALTSVALSVPRGADAQGLSRVVGATHPGQSGAFAEIFVG